MNNINQLVFSSLQNRLMLEGIILNNQTISIDLDKFESGEINKLFVVGYAGSGKSNVGKLLSDKYNCKLISFDDYWVEVCKKFNIVEGDLYRISKKLDDFEKLINTYDDLCIKDYYTNDRCIIESINIAFHYKKYKEELNKHSFIIMGRSKILSSLKATNRNLRFGKIFKSLLHYLNLNFKQFGNLLDDLRKGRSFVKNANIKVFDSYNILKK